MLLIMNGKLVKAPIENPRRVLDLGTGTGIWATDFASEHPEAEVIGLDLRYVASGGRSGADKPYSRKLNATSTR